MNAFAEMLYEALLPALNAAWNQADAAEQIEQQDLKEAA
jgi:hypothetical protein